MIITKTYLTILLLSFATISFSQTRVEGESYVKAVKMAVEAVDSGVVGLDGSYVDYPVTIPASGTYIFDLRVMGSGYINIKTLSGTKVLATANVVRSVWDDVEVPVKLGKTTKFVRLWFHGNVNLNYFTYQTQSSAKPTYITQEQFNSLKTSFDSLLQAYKNNVYIFDPEKFRWKDSANKVITTRP